MKKSKIFEFFENIQGNHSDVKILQSLHSHGLFDVKRTTKSAMSFICSDESIAIQPTFSKNMFVDNMVDTVFQMLVRCDVWQRRRHSSHTEMQGEGFAGRAGGNVS